MAVCEREDSVFITTLPASQCLNWTHEDDAHFFILQVPKDLWVFQVFLEDKDSQVHQETKGTWEFQVIFSQVMLQIGRAFTQV